MTFEEKFTLLSGRITRTLIAGRLNVVSWIEDRSKLGKTAPAWSRWWRSYLRRSKPQRSAPLGTRVNAVDLFCGCGGLALGVQEAALALGREFVVKAAVDIDR